jgi:hypothetical protein
MREICRLAVVVFSQTVIGPCGDVESTGDRGCRLSGSLEIAGVQPYLRAAKLILETGRDKFCLPLAKGRERGIGPATGKSRYMML